ncbi:probable glycosyl transferase [alpha proteobacterium U9-1i]|nr:probable glycosyl transferase [alpha proteobacterium U9-1i]
MTHDAEPLVSVIMANHNGAAHIAAAVRSVLRQTERRLELIVSDDGSSDDSLNRARDAAAGDPRLLILAHAARGGPAAARNRALAVARGRWVAIVDNDDLIHPERLATLVAQAEADNADIAADNLLTFYEDGAPAHAHLRQAPPRWIGPTEYLRTNHVFGTVPSLGYLKPIFRRSQRLRYDENLTIAEDFDLVVRLLMGGARMRVYPELGYFYRKHAHSISHRLSAEALGAMLTAQDQLKSDAPAVRQALAARRRSLTDARGFTEIVAALKARHVGTALRIAVSQPSAAALLRVPLLDKLLGRKQISAPTEGPPRIALLSRQRIVGATNGSSAYLLSIAEALATAGYAVDFIGASPKIFGRWPVMRLRPETKIFASYRVHGALKFGNILIAIDPRVALSASIAVLDRVVVKLGLPAPGWAKPAEYAQGAPATRADQLFVARAVKSNTKAVICDYAFLTPLAPYALVDAPVLTIMHDLMSARVSDSAREKTPAQVSALTPEREFALLGQSHAVLAIQAEEAAAVRTALPSADVILAPHAAPCVAAAQPGQDDLLLFVGSNTSPNVVGITRFFEASWPLVRAKRPSAQLLVAGSVARALNVVPDGVKVLGVVPDLAPLYRDAGVVVSPLHTGSGLKIKLIEAMAAGKAIVGTTVTVQGVGDIVQGAMVIEDDPIACANSIVDLLGAPERRSALGRAALETAQAHFSAAACYAGMVDYVRTGGRWQPEELRPLKAPSVRLSQ